MLTSSAKSTAAPIRFEPAALITAAAVAVAMVLGGSGAFVPGEMVVQCATAALVIVWLWALPRGALGRVPRGAWAIAALLMALPLVQLIPLPPALWHGLPGRGVEIQALELIGQADRWQPWSLTPNLTLAALLAMATAAAVLVMAAALDRNGRTLVLAAILVVALASIVLGALQLSGGDLSGGRTNPFRFYEPQSSYLDGFQANHGHQADVLMIAMVALAALARDIARRRKVAGRAAIGRRWILGVVGGITALLVLAVVLTGARMGIAMLPIPLIAQAILLRPLLDFRGLNFSRSRQALLAALTLAAMLVAIALLRHNPAIARVLGRFHTPTEYRPEIWHDATFALQQYWPFGAGMGSFMPVFAGVERLEVVSDRTTNRAHLDYLELLIEAGLPGLLVFGSIVLQLLRAVRRALRDRSAGSRGQVIAAAAALCIIAVHSLIDYPLRSMSIACIAAACAGMVCAVSQQARAAQG